MTNLTLPSIDQIKAASAAVSEVLGAVYTICTVIGNPLAKYGTGKIASLGHLVLAFGADIGKARKRIADLFGGDSTSGGS